MAATNANAINFFSPARWVVCKTAGEGTHTTITTATADASSGDTIVIMPGSYTENFTAKAGVTYYAIANPQVINNNGSVVEIIGRVTLPGFGNYSAFINTTHQNGTSAMFQGTANLYLVNCCFYSSGSSGYGVFLNASGSTINLTNCVGDFSGTAPYLMTSSNTLNINYCQFTNATNGTGIATNSTGTVNWNYSTCKNEISTSSSGVVNFVGCNIDTSALNATCVTLAGTGSSSFDLCRFSSGTATALTIGSGCTFTGNSSEIISSNATLISNSGTLNYNKYEFIGSTTFTANGVVLAQSNPYLLATASPGSTSGVPLISNGTSSAPTFGTAVVAGGGTGDTSFTAYSLITGGTTSTGALQNVSGVGTSGQVLTSNGAGALPTWQTSTAGGGILSVTGTLTSAQIKSLNANPIQVIAAPAANTYIAVIFFAVKLNYGGTNPFTTTYGQTIQLYYGTTTGVNTLFANNSNMIPSNQLNASQSLAFSTPVNVNPINLSSISATALNIYNSGYEIGGNAANDNTFSYVIDYLIF
jgi:hypothetical protein